MTDGAGTQVPPVVERVFTQAIQLHGQGKLAEAATLYRQLIAGGAGLPEAFYNLAQVERAGGNLAEAARLLRHGLSLHPGYNRGRWLLVEILNAEREGVLREIIRHDPEDLPAHRALCALHPDGPHAHSGLAAALWRARMMPEAEQVARRAVALAPDFMEAWVILGSSQKRQGKFVEAEQSFRRAIQLRPDAPIPHWNLSLIRLLFEDYEEGWREFEWRWQVDGLPSPRRSFPQAKWQGEELSGKRILVYWEQGFGDCLQFIRYLPWLKAKGCTVIFEAQANLARLLEGFDGIDELAVYGRPLPDFDCHSALMSLPLLLGRDLTPAATRTPYLSASQTLAAEWKARLAGLPGLKVGLVWAGNPEFDAGQFRSPGFSRFARLLDVPGVSFVSLQVGPGRADLPKQPSGETVIPDLGGLIRDFADTAALVEALDLVISSDTGVVHLCGAMGRPVWMATPFPPDWRWLLEGERSAWYPSLRLFRQQAYRDDWTEPFAVIKAELISLRL